eukprot:Gb_10165 [translate_table: standard]
MGSWYGLGGAGCCCCSGLMSFIFLSAICSSAMGFTIILPDSPSNLLDTPQTGFNVNMEKAHTNPKEQQAVYEVMSVTGNGWATSIPDVCKGRWHGIECMPDQSNVLHVVSLSFGALSDDTAFPTCDKNSVISPAVTRLPHLKRLFFYQCCRDNPQPIPKVIGLLSSSLESLVLRENGHIGSIPPELGNLTRLHTLDLHGNNLNSVIPPTLGKLNHLQLLDLSRNRFTGRIPSSFQGLESLNILDLNQNLLEGPIPEQLGKLFSLRKLDMSRNRLRGAIPASFGNMKSLLLLDLGYNCLFGRIPPSLGDLKFLQALILQGNSIGGPIPESLGSLEELMIMVLSNAGLKGPIPEALGRLSKLRVLCLDENRLNGSIPTNLGKLVHISEFKVSGNLLAGPVPFTREFMWKLGRRLQLGNNSGLCYEPNNPQEEEMDSSFLLGIKYCDFNITGHVSSDTTPPSVSQLPNVSPPSLKPSPASSAHGRPVSWLLLTIILVVSMLLPMLVRLD